jgi:hypothetical protein
VSADGEVTVPSNASYGPVKITVQNGTFYAYVTITIEKDVSQELTAMKVTPENPKLDKGKNLQLSVLGTYGNGEERDITLGSSGTTYTSSVPSRAVVSADGEVTVPSNASYGPVKITVQNGTFYAYVTITIEKDVSQELTAMKVTPENPKLDKGKNLQLSVLGTYGNGEERDITLGSSGTTYTSSVPSRAVVSADGEVTVPSNASYGPISITIQNGTVNVQVILIIEKDVSQELTAMMITPEAPSADRGESIQLSVSGTYGNGEERDITLGSNGTTYTSSVPSRAVVDQDGKVTIPLNASYGPVKITVQNDGIYKQIILTVKKP